MNGWTECGDSGWGEMVNEWTETDERENSLGGDSIQSKNRQEIIHTDTHPSDLKINLVFYQLLLPSELFLVIRFRLFLEVHHAFSNTPCSSSCETIDITIEYKPFSLLSSLLFREVSSFAAVYIIFRAGNETTLSFSRFSFSNLFRGWI